MVVVLVIAINQVWTATLAVIVGRAFRCFNIAILSVAALNFVFAVFFAVLFYVGIRRHNSGFIGLFAVYQVNSSEDSRPQVFNFLLHLVYLGLGIYLVTQYEAATSNFLGIANSMNRYKRKLAVSLGLGIFLIIWAVLLCIFAIYAIVMATRYRRYMRDGKAPPYGGRFNNADEAVRRIEHKERSHGNARRKSTKKHRRKSRPRVAPDGEPHL